MHVTKYGVDPIVMYVSANKSRSLISVKASALLQFISPCRSCKCTKYIISIVFTFPVNRHSYINYSEHKTITTKATDYYMYM